MDVIGHDCEGVELETTLVSIAEQSLDEEFGVGCSLEVAMLLEGRDCDGVRAWLLANCGHREKAYPRG